MNRIYKTIQTSFYAALAVIIFASGFLAVPHQASAALLYTQAANQVVYVGDTFVVEWYLDTQDQVVNSMSLNLTYSADKLDVVEVTPGNSSIDLWVKTPEVDQSAGTIKMIGGISSGIKDAHLAIFRAVFKPKETGDAKISIAKDSELLLADGQGTPTHLVFNEVNFRINPAEAKPAGISSQTHPEQDSWSKDRNVQIKVQTKPGEEYSYSFSSNIELYPDENADDVSQNLNFNDLPDGIYYFKLNSRTGKGNWTEAGVYRIKIDGTPPQDFTPQIGKDPSVFDGRAFVTFNTTDNVSGISHYEVKSGLFGTWQRVDQGYYKLPGLVLGDTIEVKVVDEAGNERITKVQVDKNMLNSVFSRPIFWVIMILSLIAVIWIIRHYFRLLKKYKVSDKL